MLLDMLRGHDGRRRDLRDQPVQPFLGVRMTLEEILHPGPPDNLLLRADAIRSRCSQQHRPRLVKPLQRRTGLFLIPCPNHRATFARTPSQPSVTIAVTSALPAVAIKATGTI